MPLTYNGTTIGKVRIEQELGDIKQKFDIQIRQGNCLAVFLHSRKLTPEEKKKHPGSKCMHSLYTFLCDEQHCKNIMKDYGDIMCGETVLKVELNMYYKECWTLLKYFTKSGHKVTCYYKEEKKC